VQLQSCIFCAEVDRLAGILRFCNNFSSIARATFPSQTERQT